MSYQSGIVYWEDRFHLFYQKRQYNESKQDTLTIEHAVSWDLLKWKSKKSLVVNNTNLVHCGSMVVDVFNSSGLMNDSNPVMVGTFTTTKPEENN